MTETENKRYYIFDWYYKKDAKYKTPLIRHSNVSLIKFTKDTSVDAKMALQIFMKQNGNLNKVEIVKIREFDEHGQIGEDIIPSENTNIIPSGR